MKHAEFTAGANDSNRRADRILRKFLPSVPLSRIYSCLRTGLIKINGKKTVADARIIEGDRIQIAAFLLEENGITNSVSVADETIKKTTQEFAFQAVFQNKHLLIINKPYDIPVHGGKENEKTPALFAAQTASDVEKSLSFKPAPLHRLDRKTTGLLVLSQSIDGARWFSYALKNHLVTKMYLGIAAGTLTQTVFWRNRFEKKQSYPSKKGQNSFHTVIATANGREAETHAEPLATGTYGKIPITLIRYGIYTGRTHQIRAQSALNGFPLLGDSAYGEKTSHKKNEDRDFFLHAYELRFPEDNPLGLPNIIRCEPDEKFERMCRLCLLDSDNSPYNG